MCSAGLAGRLPSALNQYMFSGALGCGRKGSPGFTGRIWIGLAQRIFSRIGCGMRSAWRLNSSTSLGRFSGPSTSGMLGWCSKPGSSAWKEALQKKIGWPFWIAVTRRVLKLPPSRTRSTW